MIKSSSVDIRNFVLFKLMSELGEEKERGSYKFEFNIKKLSEDYTKLEADFIATCKKCGVKREFLNITEKDVVVLSSAVKRTVLQTKLVSFIYLLKDKNYICGCNNKKWLHYDKEYESFTNWILENTTFDKVTYLNYKEKDANNNNNKILKSRSENSLKVTYIKPRMQHHCKVCNTETITESSNFLKFFNLFLNNKYDELKSLLKCTYCIYVKNKKEHVLDLFKTIEDHGWEIHKDTYDFLESLIENRNNERKLDKFELNKGYNSFRLDRRDKDTTKISKKFNKHKVYRASCKVCGHEISASDMTTFYGKTVNIGCIACNMRKIGSAPKEFSRYRCEIWKEKKAIGDYQILTETNHINPKDLLEIKCKYCGKTMKGNLAYLYRKGRENGFFDIDGKCTCRESKEVRNLRLKYLFQEDNRISQVKHLIEIFNLNK